MGPLENIRVHFSGYKCFRDKDEPAGYERILPVNLIIGRNNSGKSSLIDLIEYLCTTKVLGADLADTSGLSFIFSDVLRPEELQRVFPASVSGDEIEGNHWEFGQRLIGSRLTWKYESGNPHVSQYLGIEPPLYGYETGLRTQKMDMAQNKGNPFSGYDLFRLSAERDIVPEEGTMMMSPNGSGATGLVANYINLAKLPSDLIEIKLLDGLNKIFYPDSQFSRITVQLNESLWEVYLDEEGKGRVALSQSGSGLKTILLVLLHLHVLTRDKSLSNCLFAFEELENNLHPAMQRRLLQYIRDFVVKEKARVFLSTHSHIAIDMFAQDDEAQLLHVTSDGKASKVRTTSGHASHSGILTDLDVRASDLLQSNGIVWVEGPSDRIYFNRWIDLWTNGKLKEGVHYQCVFYSGSLRSHVTANIALTNEDVQLLLVNRHMIFLMDSDKKAEGDALNSSKVRMIEELKDSQTGMSWVTKGRDIENYLPADVVTALCSKTETNTETGTGADMSNIYKDFQDILNDLVPEEGKRFERAKVEFARRASPLLTKKNIEANSDLSSNLTKACHLIRKWNAMPEDATDIN